MATALSREFALVASCCRWNFIGASNDRPAVATDLDWRKVLTIARFHRVQGLVWNAVAPHRSAIPDLIRDELASDARSIAASSLAAANESYLLSRAANQVVPLLFLKGAALASLVYAEPAAKAAVDIDLLIEPSGLGQVAELLRERGYGQIIPSSRRDLAKWHRGSKESVWTKANPPFQVDLHTRVTDNARLIPDVTARSPSQLIDIGRRRQLRTLADEELFAFLAVHGASSAWFRLKWISDFAGFLDAKDASEIDRLYRRSQELGAGRAAGQGLLLADRLFGTLAGNDALRDELLLDRATRYLVTTSLALLSRHPSEPTERFLGTLPLHLNTILLKPGLRYKLSELAGESGRLLNRLCG